MVDSAFLGNDETFEGRLISEENVYEATTIASPAIVVASSLSNLLVAKCLNSGVVAIITKESAAFSHAANIIRMSIASGNRINWVYNVEINHLLPYLGKNIRYYDHGLYCDSSLIVSTSLEVNTRHIEEMATKAISEYNCRGYIRKHIYFPETHFTKFAFSLMEDSLLNELGSWFHYYDCGVELNEYGNIEFRNAPFLSEINSAALDNNFISNYLANMKSNYNSIYSRLKQDPYSYSNLCSCARSYYQTFLLLHRSYNQLFRKMYWWLVNELESEERANAVMNVHLTCMIDSWLISQKDTPINKKVFLQDEPEVSLPDFNVEEDIICSFSKLEVSTKALSYKFFAGNKDVLMNYTLAFVLKEWKFVFYKVIFTHIKSVFEKTGLLGRFSKDQISSMTFSEVEHLL